MNEIDPEYLKRCRTDALGWALSKGFVEHAQDFASHVMLKVACGAEMRTLKLMHYDFLRQDVCDFRNAERKSRHTRYLEILNDDDESEENEIKFGVVPMGEDGRDKKEWSLHDFSIQLHLCREERILMFLFFKWGLTQREVAEVFGLTESRMSQLFSELLQRVKRKSTEYA